VENPKPKEPLINADSERAKRIKKKSKSICMWRILQ
jgi:hypothetical protein